MRTLLSALVWGGGILLVGGILCCRFALTSMFTGLVAAGFGLSAVVLAGVLAVLTMLLLFRLEWSLLLYVAIACLPPLVMVWVVGVEAVRSPLIHDITTDTRNPPEFEFAWIGRESQDNSLNYQGGRVADLQRQAYPDITPMAVSLPPLELLPKVESIAEALGWKLIGSDELTLRVEAQERSALFGFVDDVVIRLSDYGEGSSRVDVRSVSRLGRGDLGANAARIRRFYEALCSVPGSACMAVQDTESSRETSQKSVDSISPDS